jgi:hypothetical protein
MQQEGNCNQKKRELMSYKAMRRRREEASDR